MLVSKEYRAQRWIDCARYLREAGSIAAAKRLARKHGFGAATSVWITALAKMLKGDL